MIIGILPLRVPQLDFFSTLSVEEEKKAYHVMNVIEQINQKYGRQTIHLAAEGVKKTWSMKRQIRSPCYTTRWSELPVVYAR